ncbi:DUF7266 family protein [Halorubrum vacuolatum]|uniref:Flagellin N-terminal-like domain-containing protein n=1 Tax=Halorubrum vacuolatum TaxID=63740 RepID=A0A238WXP0_HALVU|nr:hypothetical protein [Halorubrum vacuolatum]SNR51111.1 hypothetical protein SAMN06264855_11112 [Halorubrum vacuolatum]
MRDRRRASFDTRREERAVSVTVGYVLTLTIATLLLSGLFIAGGSFVQGEREQAIHGEMTVIGERVAADIMTVDRLASDSGDAEELTATRTAEFPPRVSGDDYTVEIDAGSQVVILTHPRSDVSVEVPYRATNDVEPTTVGGGDLIIRWDDDRIEVIET